jgi:hypothetical protein
LGKKFKDLRTFNLRRVTQFLPLFLTLTTVKMGRLDLRKKSGGEEDLGDVDADPRELIAAKRSKSFPPSFVFGESKVTTNLIREYEAAGFFPTGDGRAPLMSKFLSRSR